MVNYPRNDRQADETEADKERREFVQGYADAIKAAEIFDINQIRLIVLDLLEPEEVKKGAVLSKHQELFGFLSDSLWPVNKTPLNWITGRELEEAMLIAKEDIKDKKVEKTETSERDGVIITLFNKYWSTIPMSVHFTTDVADEEKMEEIAIKKFKQLVLKAILEHYQINQNEEISENEFQTQFMTTIREILENGGLELG